MSSEYVASFLTSVSGLLGDILIMSFDNGTVYVIFSGIIIHGLKIIFTSKDTSIYNGDHDHFIQKI